MILYGGIDGTIETLYCLFPVLFCVGSFMTLSVARLRSVE